MYVKFFKPFFDFILAFLLLLLFSPLFIILVIVILISLRESAFFIHQRPGYKGKPIHLLKFRTMNSKKDENGKLLLNNQRITKLGYFMRKYSLDEIPQLINVIKGDLSLVGPRPLEMRSYHIIH